jgi:hypothetical protein
MRTTLVIDDDVLGAAKELAAIEKISIGQVISSLARQALSQSCLCLVCRKRTRGLGNVSADGKWRAADCRPSSISEFPRLSCGCGRLVHCFSQVAWACYLARRCFLA